MLRALDIYVLLKLAALEDARRGERDSLEPGVSPSTQRPSYGLLADQIGVSSSQVHSAVKSLMRAGLVGEDGMVRPNALMKVLEAVKYYIPADTGGPARGLPTSFAARPLADKFVFQDNERPVWPDVEGVAGLAVTPIHKSAPQAARKDPYLYAFLALADALRIGRQREVAEAKQELRRRLGLEL